MKIFMSGPCTMSINGVPLRAESLELEFDPPAGICMDKIAVEWEYRTVDVHIDWTVFDRLLAELTSPPLPRAVWYRFVGQLRADAAAGKRWRAVTDFGGAN